MERAHYTNRLAATKSQQQRTSLPTHLSEHCGSRQHAACAGQVNTSPLIVVQLPTAPPLLIYWPRACLTVRVYTLQAQYSDRLRPAVTATMPTKNKELACKSVQCSKGNTSHWPSSLNALSRTLHSSISPANHFRSPLPYGHYLLARSPLSLALPSPVSSFIVLYGTHAAPGAHSNQTCSTASLSLPTKKRWLSCRLLACHV